MLTKREDEVMKVLRTGASNLEIAQELNVSTETVKTYLSRIYAELGAKNRVHAVFLYSDWL